MDKGVQRWAVNISNWNPSPEEFSSFLSLLPLHEHGAITRFLQFKDKKRALVSRLLQYLLVDVVLGIPFNDIFIRRTKEGKPYLVNQVAHDCFPNFNFNSSHHGDYVAVASEPLCLVGIDIMSYEPSRDSDIFFFLQNFWSCFTTFEWINILNSGPSDSDILNQFYRYWCLKEAYIKAVGVGFGYKLDRLEFYFPENQNWSDVAYLRIDGIHQEAWKFSLCQLDAHHWVCIAKGPPYSATFNYHQTLWKTDFCKRDYEKELELPNKPFVFLEAAEIMKAIRNGNDYTGIITLDNSGSLLACNDSAPQKNSSQRNIS
eukprot:TRINITY_DN6360_c0_g1_i1.p1 TRINITY_DN6360_c0_g1~~TRINITY_DN6360_c0_g1_i1.p1  ORF type:complete len:316 (-),score=51.02 TRINITY_DN6360_c0_g1_i1:215-1162(-)